MTYKWEDLPKPLNCFTVRTAAMVNLNNGKIVRQYAPNTKIVVVQKCVSENGTYYRTAEAYHYYLNYAFKASAFGLPNEEAPSVPLSKSNSLDKSSPTKSTKTRKSTKKTKINPKAATPKDGEEKRHTSWLKKIFGREND